MVVISKLYPEVIKVCRPFIIENEVLKLLVKKFSHSVTKSLSAQHAYDSTVKCNLTHVMDFPDGREKGSFIGLEFSGRIFRLVYTGLKGDRTYVSLSRLYEFPYQKLNEPLEKVVDYVAKCINNFIETYDICEKKIILGVTSSFQMKHLLHELRSYFKAVVDYVAKCINNFIETYDICEKKIILGVTSSFQMKQECLQEGKILQWGKDFQCYNLGNQDFYTELKMSLRKYKNTRSIFFISLINNSTACLLCGLYKDPSTRIGLFLGDDTNVSYVEKFENITISTSDGLRMRTAIGVEMKNFGDDGVLDFIRTEFDFQIDSTSSNPGQFVFDKMVSAANLGEIARLCLNKLATLKIILDGHVSPALSMKDSLKTTDIAMMEMDNENTFIRCKAIMFNLGYKTVTEEDCVQIRFVCRCIAKRSAHLIAACLSAIFFRMETKYFHIMADGYLFTEFPNYENYLIKKIKELKKPKYKCQFIKGNKDDLAVGAGLVAHIYKDEIIKLEEKHRVLPPFNINKYNMANPPVSCIDCNCQPKKVNRRTPVGAETESLTESKKELEITEIVEPVFSSPNSFGN